MAAQLMALFVLCFYVVAAADELSIYEALRSNGLPMGLLPRGAKDFRLDAGGRFEVHLDRECNAKFESELHYERNISGTLSYGQIAGLSGLSAQDLFLWFPVKEIRVDIPTSGLIYFDVGVVHKEFSLSSFETPRDCVAAQTPDFAWKTVLSRVAGDSPLLLPTRLIEFSVSDCNYSSI